MLVEGLALRRPAPTAAQVHRQVTAVSAEQGWPVPTYSTVYAIIRGIDPDATPAARVAHARASRFLEQARSQLLTAGTGTRLNELRNRLGQAAQAPRPEGPARDLAALRARLSQPTPAPDPGRDPHDPPHPADGPERPDGPDYSR
jgi:putative transposase